MVYLETTRYNSGLNTLTRQAGWYCFPRWLGWNYQLSDITGTEGIDSLLTFESSFTGGANNGESISFSTNTTRFEHVLPQPPAYQGNWSLKLAPASEDASFTISQMSSPSEITLGYWSGAADTHVIEFRESNGSLIDSFTLAGQFGWFEFSYEFKKLNTPSDTI